MPDDDEWEDDADELTSDEGELCPCECEGAICSDAPCDCDCVDQDSCLCGE